MKKALYNLLEGEDRQHRPQQIFDFALITLILANVMAVVLSTVESIQLQYGRQFYLFELFSVTVFTAELILRFWVADMDADGNSGVSRLKFWKSKCTVIDIIAVLPFYLSVFINVDLRLLRLLRLLRVFRISPYFRSLALLESVLKQEFRPILSALMVIFILMFFVAGGIYLLERESQPDSFGDMPSALWWVVVTLSTVGYGDAVPVTLFGKVLGAVIMILGVGMVALPAGMLASRFSEVMHRKQNLFRGLVEDSISHNSGDIDEVYIEQQRQLLFISKGEARSIIDDSIEASKRKLRFCPACGGKLPE